MPGSWASRSHIDASYHIQYDAVEHSDVTAIHGYINMTDVLQFWKIKYGRPARKLQHNTDMLIGIRLNKIKLKLN